MKDRSMPVGDDDDTVRLTKGRFCGVDIRTAEKKIQLGEVTSKDELGVAFEGIQKIIPESQFNIGRADALKCVIDVTGDPIRSIPCKLTSEKEEFLKRSIDEMLRNDLIERARFPEWTSPVFIVKSKDKMRLCVDYRALNKITVPETHPIPRIANLLVDLRGARYFSTIDMAKGYRPPPLDEGLQRYTTSSTKTGSYKWKVMPFGLKNAPMVFQLLIDGGIMSHVSMGMPP
eukprot:GHVP01029749.1.p1 GENE.GHVP01029749.1~~GHVP01029749.1.p1  ORF type:complete len:231 (-),score=23.35 GHVP01029749.1:52-744(-)